MGTDNAPHDRVPGYSQCISNQCYGIYGAGARIGYKYSVAYYDDDKERQWVYWSGYPATVCCDACQGNEEEPADCDRDVEQLGLSNGPAKCQWPLIV